VSVENASSGDDGDLATSLSAEDSHRLLDRCSILKVKPMVTTADVVIVGAGPYGLSLAAHLRGLGVHHQVIGKPMESWSSRMPKGMLLKSPGFASNLHDPDMAFTLKKFREERGEPYEDLTWPVPLDDFLAYGLAFQRRFAPDVEDENLAALTPEANGFELHMTSGRSLRARKVVVAVGLSYFQYVPEPLARLGDERVSHAARHSNLEELRGKRVAVLGGGSSAIDLAVLLSEAGADVQLIARKPAIDFGHPWRRNAPRLRTRIRYPLSGIGPGWKHRVLADLPWLFRYLPDSQRLRIARTFLGPQGQWAMKDRAENVPLLLGYALQNASAGRSGVRLELESLDGQRQTVEVDHVIAATGYKADVSRLPFLDKRILEHLSLIGQTPRLSRSYESSVPGLYFVGPISATTFGPVMRFVFGAGFASRKLAGHLAKTMGVRAANSGWLDQYGLQFSGHDVRLRQIGRRNGPS